MPSFSERYGYEPEKSIQINDLREETRIRLWNYIDRALLKYYPIEILETLWLIYMKKPHDLFPKKDSYWLKEIVLEKEFFRTFDLIEVLFQKVFVGLKKDREDSIRNYFNLIFEEENVGYRLIGSNFTAITDLLEMKVINSALLDYRNTIKVHLKTSLDLLSEKSSSSYRNSIKESISAIESLVRSETGESDFKVALKKFEEKYEADLHGGFRAGLCSLYGYTSDEQGIRHAILEQGRDVRFKDAKYMLVMCSALINYLTAKQAKVTPV